MGRESQLMILSLPNSGSDWFAPMVAECCGLSYTKEFFSPICNAKHRSQLEPVFGCEMIPCHRNIAVPWQSQEAELDAVYCATWEQENFTCTKDVFGFRKAGWFAKNFSMIGLLRDEALTFPPSRRGVQVWYDAMFQAMFGHSFVPCLKERVLMAFRQATVELRVACESHRAPIINYRTLLEGDILAVRDEVSRIEEVIAVNHRKLAEMILETRRVPSESRYWG